MSSHGEGGCIEMSVLQIWPTTCVLSLPGMFRPSSLVDDLRKAIEASARTRESLARPVVSKQVPLGSRFVAISATQWSNFDPI
jgi:hypothetical protein